MDRGLRLARKLRRYPASILNDAEVEFLAAQVRELLVTEFAQLFAERPRTRFEDLARWRSIAARCQQARDERGLSLKDAAAAAKVPRYRAEATEKGSLHEIRADLARRYFSFLALERWVTRWIRANPELAIRSGLVEAGAARHRGSQGRARTI